MGRLPACERKHGDPFPLHRRDHHDRHGPWWSIPSRRVDMVVASLNHLAIARPNSSRRSSSPTSPRRPLQTAVQTAMLESIGNRVVRFGSPSPEATLEASFQELMAVRYLYSQEPKHLAPFELFKLRWPRVPRRRGPSPPCCHQDPRLPSTTSPIASRRLAPRSPPWSRAPSRPRLLGPYVAPVSVAAAHALQDPLRPQAGRIQGHGQGLRRSFLRPEEVRHDQDGGG